MRIRQSPGSTVAAAKVYDVTKYGAKVDGTTDDSAALLATFNAMKADGTHATGVLYVPAGSCVLATPLVLDGGYANVANSNEAQYATNNLGRFSLQMDGSFKVAAGTGTALTIKNMHDARLSIAFIGGGQASDVALLLQAMSGMDLDLYAQNFAGLVSKADGATVANDLTMSRVRSLVAVNCGKCLDWRNINAFGSIDYIWDNNNVLGSYFFNCADIDIGYLTNFSPASQTNGWHFDGCNNCGIQDIDLGDRATASILRISSDGGNPSDFGYIGNCRVSSNGTPAACVTLDEVSSITIHRLQTTGTVKGLQILGGGQNKIKVVHHFSLSQDTNPLYIGPHTNNTPLIEVGCHYRNCKNEAVKIITGLTGGSLKLSGQIDTFNNAGSTSVFGIDCASAAFVVDVAGLEMLARSTAGGAIQHTTPDNIRNVSRALIGVAGASGQRVEHTAQPATWAGTAFTIAQQNLSGRTLVISCSVRLVASASNTAPEIDVLLGPTSAKVTTMGWWVKAYVSTADNDASFFSGLIRIPPYWWFQLNVAGAGASISNSKFYLE